VHVFTSGDEAELFLNNESLGRKKKQPYEYRLRWDEVRYQPGSLRAVAYKNGQEWAETVVETTSVPAQLEATVDRQKIYADGKDLAFVTVRVTDEQGRTVPDANNPLKFSIDGPGEIVATDSGDSTDLTSFHSHERASFNGLCLVIVRAIPGQPDTITLSAESESLTSTSISVTSISAD